MNLTLKALGALLTYPDAELRAALPEIIAAIEQEKRLKRDELAGMRQLADDLGAGDPLDVEERYVALFDRGRKLSLNLFEHVHGESRDRGQAMVDLLDTYRRAGFRLAASQLPDYLPVLLEFLSLRSDAETREMLGDCAHILRAIGEALRDRDSVYSAVFAALLAIAGEAGLGKEKRAVAEEEEKSLDEEWAEEPVIFGPDAAPKSCHSTPARAQPRGATPKSMPRAA